MRVRYADSREERAVLVKTEHMLVVRHPMDFKTALDWQTCQHLLAVDRTAISAQANDMLAADSTCEETPKHLLRDLVKPKRRFNIAAVTAHVRATRAQKQQPPTAVVGQRSAHEPMLPMTDQGMNRRWVMVKPKEHLEFTCYMKPVRHLCADAGEVRQASLSCDWKGPAPASTI